MTVSNTVDSLRSSMIANNLDAYLVTGTDPHLSEYVPAYWKTREWATGFTGSYGKVLVTSDKIMLWTDTRYFLQASIELEGTEIILMKERVPEAISIDDWILGNLEAGSTLGVDGLTISTAEAAQIESKLNANGMYLTLAYDLVSPFWKDRPIHQYSSCYDYPVNFAGKSRSEKINMVRNQLILKNLDSTTITMLDDIAWLFNLRSDEITYTPIFTAYAYLDHDDACLFVDPAQLSSELKDLLEKDGISVFSYDYYFKFLARINGKRVQIDPVRTNSLIPKQLNKSNIIDSSLSIVTHLKAVKEPQEVFNLKNALAKDGVAMVQALYWIGQTIHKGNVTEIAVGNKLNEFRSKQSFFKGDSFHPIVGSGSHGAIIHYHATDQSNRIIEPDNLLLIDSGGQYLDGTTDITRTIALGSVSKKQKEDYTTCLKAHIALATAVFPAGTKGYSLDAIARKPLWDRGLNYGHGTGHGVGYFLSVHEGPMSIRTEYNNEPIREGNVLSNEPGIYREGEYGIRIENLILCKRHSTGEFGNFLCFETLTLCPLERKLINIELLTKIEIDWINHYHENLRTKIAPLLEDRTILEWFILQCLPLQEFA